MNEYKFMQSVNLHLITWREKLIEIWSEKKIGVKLEEFNVENGIEMNLLI